MTKPIVPFTRQGFNAKYKTTGKKSYYKLPYQDGFTLCTPRIYDAKITEALVSIGQTVVVDADKYVPSFNMVDNTIFNNTMLSKAMINDNIANKVVLLECAFNPLEGVISWFTRMPQHAFAVLERDITDNSKFNIVQADDTLISFYNEAGEEIAYSEYVDTTTFVSKNTWQYRFDLHDNFITIDGM